MRVVLVICIAVVLALFFVACEKGIMNGVNAKSAPLPQNDLIMGEDLTIDDIIAMNDSRVEILYDKDNVTPISIVGKFSNTLIKNEKDALQSIASVRKLLNITAFDFTCNTSEIDGKKMYTLYQLYKGIPVVSRMLTITANANGEPVSIQGRYAPNITIDINPDITEKEAFEMLKNELNAKIKSCALVIYFNKDVPVLCWSARVKQKSSDDKLVYLNANDGEIIAEVPLSTNLPTK
jgi:Zn-dependent metalloprotease